MVKITSFVLSLFMLTFIVTPTFSATNTAAEEQPVYITVGHTNDIHGRNSYDENNQTIGFARAKTLLNEYDLLFDAGDFFHGLAFATLEKGESMAEIMKEMNYTAMTVGNHDWNYGKDRLLELENLSDTPILAANILKDNGEPYFNTPYLIKEVKGIKVGIFGVIDPDVYGSTAPKNLEGITYEDPVVYGNRVVEELKNNGADIIIGLSHCNSYQTLASSIADVDVLITGHLHQEINTKIGDTLVVQAQEHSKLVGKVTLCYQNGEVTTAKEEFITFDKAKTAKEDENIKAIIDRINEEQEPVLSKVVGISPERLIGDKLIVRKEETNLGRVVTDSFLKETGADIAFQNGGAIRATIEKGPVTMGDVISVSPFGDNIITKELSGQAIINCLEKSIEQGLINEKAYIDGVDPGSDGQYLQVGGITVKYDVSLEKGNRVKLVMVGNEALDLNKTYIVAGSEYIMNDTYYQDLYNAKILNEYASVQEVLAKYISEGGIEKSYQVQRLYDVTGISNEEEKTNENSNTATNEDVIDTVSDNVNEEVTSSAVSAEPMETGDSIEYIALIPISILALLASERLLRKGKKSIDKD